MVFAALNAKKSIFLNKKNEKQKEENFEKLMVFKKKTIKFHRKTL